MSSYRLLAARFLSLAALAFLASSARASGPITSFGTTINTPGVYFLARDLHGSGDGIRIASNDVTLLLLGFELDGDGTGNGISWDGYDRVQIIGGGGRVEDFDTLIELSNTSSCRIENLELRDAEDCIEGLEVDHSYFGRLNVSRAQDQGIRFRGCSYNKLVNIDSQWNGIDGIQLIRNANGGRNIGSAYNYVGACTTANNGRFGIFVFDSSFNELVGNVSTHNRADGIALDLFTLLGSDDNVLKGNACHSNGRYGISLAFGCQRNRVTNCTALFNSARDLFDDSFLTAPCSNTWATNIYFTRGGVSSMCIH